MPAVVISFPPGGEIHSPSPELGMQVNGYLKGDTLNGTLKEVNKTEEVSSQVQPPPKKETGSIPMSKPPKQALRSKET